MDDLIEKLDSINSKINHYLSTFYSYLKADDISLSDICDIKYGKRFEASSLDFNYKSPVYGGNGIIGTLDSYMFDKHKIAISCRGAASGNVIVTKKYSSISSNSLYLELYNEKSFLPLYYFLCNADVKSFCTGSAQPQITIENIKSLKVPNLSMVNDKMKLFQLYQTNLEKIDKLSEIKQKLLAKYF